MYYILFFQAVINKMRQLDGRLFNDVILSTLERVVLNLHMC